MTTPKPVAWLGVTARGTLGLKVSLTISVIRSRLVVVCPADNSGPPPGSLSRYVETVGGREGKRLSDVYLRAPAGGGGPQSGVDTCAAQIRLFKSKALGAYAGEVGVPQHRLAQISPDQRRFPQPAPGQLDATQVCSGQHRQSEVDFLAHDRTHPAVLKC